MRRAILRNQRVLGSLLSVYILSTLTACDSDGNRSKTKVPDGVFIDSPVEGLAYTTYSETLYAERINKYGPPLSAALSADGRTVLLSPEPYSRTIGDTFFMLSKDSGVSWKLVDIPVAGPANRLLEISGLLVSPNGRLLIGYEAHLFSKRAFISRDGGETWAVENTFLPCSSTSALISVNDTTLLAVGSTALDSSFADLTGCLEISTDEGLTWTPVNRPVEQFASHDVASSKDGQVIVLAMAGSSYKGIYRSVDGGKTWLFLDRDDHVYSVEMSQNGLTILAAGANAVHLSTDGGDTWSVTEGTHRITDYIYSLYDARPPSNRLKISGANKIIAMSADGSKMLKGTGYDTQLVSEDGGQFWRKINTGGQASTLGMSADGTTVLTAPKYDNGRSKAIKITRTGLTEYTDANGGFNCAANSDVTFMIGNQALHTLKCASIVHVLQMEDGDETVPKAMRIARYLQTLGINNSKDGEGIDKRIKIPMEAHDKNTKVELAGTEQQFTTSVQNADKAVNGGTEKPVVTEAEAKKHIDQAAEKIAPALKEKLCETNACGKDAQTLANPAPTGRIGGTVTGLPAGSALSLVLNTEFASLSALGKTTETISLASNNVYKFSRSVKAAAPYNVKLSSDDPVLLEHCELANASGTTASDGNSIDDVNITCTIPVALNMTIGGSVSGLGLEQSLVLTNFEESIVIRTNGQFSFPESYAADTPYDVVVASTVPSRLDCAVQNGTGTIPTSYESSKISDISVICNTLPTYAISGSVSGLPEGGSLLLNNRDSDRLTPVSMSVTNGVFEFTSLFTGDYNLSMSNLPEGFLCTLSSISGAAELSGVSVDIECGADPSAGYRIEGSVSGLPTGEQITIVNTDSLAGAFFETVNANGNYTFDASFSGNYSLSVTGAPNGLACVFSPTNGGPEFPRVTADIVCTGAVISGAVSGLPEGTSIELYLSLSSGDQGKSIAAASPTFQSYYLQPGTAYTVTVQSTSAGVTCGPVVNGSGTIQAEAVTNISIACSATNEAKPAGALGGSVSGLLDGDIVMIEDSVGNGGFLDSAGNGAFTLPNGLAPGDSYSITVTYGGPPESGGVCSVSSGGTGTMPAVDAEPNYVDDIVIACSYP
ncbi:WD40/YVTN/BNR-like repeat-containing protein [Allohahella sp. A8]|uniref:WD40/YVTN/BNR-like repeat-containing protein n=1 Tax=Allohahella sp. A8 TaxID=3141461 RepID=UPI003A80D41E